MSADQAAESTQSGQASAALSAREIMQTVRERHDLHPHVFERLTFITTDRQGRRNVRKARRYWRIEPDGAFHFLLTFIAPREVRGVAMLASREAVGLNAANSQIDAGIFLPAFGPTLKRSSGSGHGAKVLGTDFSVLDLSPEDLDAFDYRRLADAEAESEVTPQSNPSNTNPGNTNPGNANLGQEPSNDDQPIALFVIEAIPKARAARGEAAKRQLYIRQQTFFIERIDYFDARNRLIKRRTAFDLHRVKGQTLRANMQLMEDFQGQHRSLMKVEERVYSEDYVPKPLFALKNVFAMLHLEPPEYWSRQASSTKASSAKASKLPPAAQLGLRAKTEAAQ